MLGYPHASCSSSNSARLCRHAPAATAALTAALYLPQARGDFTGTGKEPATKKWFYGSNMTRSEFLWLEYGKKWWFYGSKMAKN